MKLSIFAFVVALLTRSCVLLPPDNSFQATLENQSDNGQSCLNTSPTIFIDGGAAEILQVKFKDSFALIDLIPEGDERSDGPVKWSKLSSTGPEALASLTRPGELEVGKINKLTGSSICITFHPALLESNKDFEAFQSLSGVECCGLLTEEK